MSTRSLARIALTTCLVLASLPDGRSSEVAAQQVTPPQIEARRAELQKILDQYAAGDWEIVSRSLRKSDGLTRAALLALLGNKEAEWKPARAAFALEIGALWGAGFFFDMDSLTRYTRDILARRPTPIGDNVAEDRFELLCHQIALALLESSGAWPMHRAYLAAAGPRLVKLEAKYPNVANRIPLMRAMDAAMHCCSTVLASKVIPLVNVMISSGGGMRPGQTPEAPPTPEYAVLLFETAARSAALRQEALVRGAFVLEKYGKVAQGLAMMERATEPGDPIVDYGAALIRAGLLDRAGRPDEAAQSYRAAMKIGPGAQTPAIGLAAALLRAGQIDDAAAAAEHARRMPADGFDPWPTFLYADARFVPTWIVQMREFLK